MGIKPRVLIRVLVNSSSVKYMLSNFNDAINLRLNDKKINYRQSKKFKV